MGTGLSHRRGPRDLPPPRTRPAVLALAGLCLAVLTAGIGGIAATVPAPHPDRRLAGGRHGGHPGRAPSPGEVLLEPDLLQAIANGHEPVDPHDTVGSAIVSGRLLFIGASYSVGLGATGRAFAFPTLLAERFHQPFRVDAVSGTGFQDPGPLHQGTFAERLVRDPGDPPPRVVIIQGGRDDYPFPVADEYPAALHTIELAQQRFEQAQVVVLGPIPGHLPVTPRLVQVRDEIQRAALVAHAGFIDPLAQDWITLANEADYAGRIRGHPNDAGYAYIADRLREELPLALSESRPPLQPDGS
jgi:hypothetical protein